MERPRRQFEVDIHISGDTWDDINGEMEHLADRMNAGPQCGSVSGGCDSGHSLTVVHTPGKTSEQYHEELVEYLEWKQANAKADANS